MLKRLSSGSKPIAIGYSVDDALCLPVLTLFSFGGKVTAVLSLAERYSGLIAAQKYSSKSSVKCCGFCFYGLDGVDMLPCQKRNGINFA